MRIFIPALILAGCDLTAPDAEALDTDPTPVAEAVRAVQPGPLLDLVQRTDAVIGTGADCPRIEILATATTEHHERWTGGCALDDGTEVLGSLERFQSNEGSWITGADFRLVQADETVFGFDGAVEVTEIDALWLVDIAASVCGIEGWACGDGLLGMDITTTVFPASTFPEDYDITVSGAIATDRSTMTVDGAWSVNRASCAIEPTECSLTVRQGELHALTLDGSQSCDACGGWEVQGQPTSGLCGLNQ